MYVNLIKSGTVLGHHSSSHCTTLEHTQLKLMTMWIIIGYSHTTDTDTIEKHSIGTDMYMYQWNLTLKYMYIKNSA